MDTPFSFGKIVGEPDFTDREKESLWLQQQVLAKNNCMLISPRRWGKSSLVQHAAGKIRKKHPNKVFCFIDLYNIRTEKEFYEAYSREIIKATANNLDEIAKTVKTFFKQIIPKISFSPDPATDIQLSLDWEEVKKNPSEILNLPEKIGQAKKKDIIICLDEFQNISFFDFPLPFQKKLRAHWQKHQNTVYCLYGSKRHLLMDFFTKPSMPFYKFGDILFLEKIPETYWVSFIMERFAATGKKISKEQAGSIAAIMKNHPYFVQQLAQSVWLRTPKKCTDVLIENTVSDLLDQYTILYQKEVEQLTNPQLNFLKALCDGVAQLSSSETIAKYKLGTSANIPRIKTALENKELIDIIGKQINFNDPLFELWLKKKYFIA
jgi:uncharacterized protein